MSHITGNFQVQDSDSAAADLHGQVLNVLKTSTHVDAEYMCVVLAGSSRDWGSQCKTPNAGFRSAALDLATGLLVWG